MVTQELRGPVVEACGEFLWEMFLGVFGEVPWIKQEVTKMAQRLLCYVAL